MLQRLYLVLATSAYIVLDETYCVTPPDADLDDGTESTESIRIQQGWPNSRSRTI